MALQLRARAAFARLPPPPRPAELLPSGRAVAVTLTLAVVALLVYMAVRSSALFAVRTIRVQGASGPVARSVEAALRPLEGRSLLKVHGDEVTRLATALPSVAAISYDREFPNTLRVRVVTERPLAVVRRGAEAWLVSRTGRVTARIAQRTHRTLPRIWLPMSVDVSLGARLEAGGGAEEVRLLEPVRDADLGRYIATARTVDGQAVYILRGGLELRAGSPTELPLKLAIAARILAKTPVAGYLDVSVPERPVATIEPQLSS